MILMDYQPVALAALAVSKNDIKEDKSLVRHIIFNTIRRYNMQFKGDYGNLVICMDSIGNWRKEEFPQYKASRKKNRDKDKEYWNDVFEVLNEIRDDVKTVLPYKCLSVQNAEADDIIGTIVHEHQSPESILILSPDHDFKQLQIYPKVKQYSTMQKKYVVSDDPEAELFEKICRGDAGDGVPNALSDDDVFVSGQRQTPISKKKIEALKEDFQSLGHGTAKRFIRNKNMIDLRNTPDALKQEIMSQFEETPKGSINALMTYLMKHRMRLLIESLSDFESPK